MDNYDVVIERTVRDLFKSSPLPQIKKFKFTKEKEIQSKDESLKNLILEKYPILIKSVSSLDKISESLDELHNIRNKICENMKRIEENLIEENIFNLKKEDFIFENEINNEFNENANTISDRLDDCWELLNDEQCYENLVLDLINTKKILIKIKYNFENKIHFENYDFILVQFLENIMKNFVKCEISNYFTKSKSFELFFINIFSIYHLINNQDKLKFSEFYYKILSDKKIDSFLNNVFIAPTSLNEPQMNNYTNVMSWSLTLVFKLILLKLSNNLSNMTTIIEYKTNLEKNLIEVYSISYFILKLLTSLNKLISFSHSEDLSLSNSSNEELEEIKKFEDCFLNFLDILENVGIIFSLQECELLKNHLSLRNDIYQSFLNFIKNELRSNINPIICKFNCVTFWQNIYSTVSNLYGNEANSLYQNCIKDNNSLFEVLFLETAQNQVNQLITSEIEKISLFNFKNFEETGHNIFSLIKDLNQIKNNNTHVWENFYISTISIIDTKLTDYFENNKKIISNQKATVIREFISFLVKNFCNNKFIQYFDEKISEKYLVYINFFMCHFNNNLFEEIECFVKNIKDNITIENYSDSDQLDTNSESLNEIANYLENKFTLSQDCITISNEEIKLKILKIIFNNFIETLLELQTDGRKLKIQFTKDIALFRSILLKLKNFEEELNILNQFEVCEVIIDDSMFLFYYFTNQMHLFKSKKTTNAKFIIDQNEVKLRDYLPFTSKLQVFLLDYAINKNIKPTSNQGLNINSTSKLLDLRIDENYLSIKNNTANDSNNKDQEKKYNIYANKSNSSSNSSSTNQPNLKDYLGFFGGKLKENISNITKNVINNLENPKK